MKKIIALMLFLLSSQLWAQTEIRFATEATYPPFEYINSQGQIEGFDIDLAKAICQAINAQCSFSNQPWDSLIPSLKIGKFDALIGAMEITAERQQEVSFSDAYYHNSVLVVANKKSGFDLTPTGLQGKSIGVQRASTFFYYLKSKFGKQVTIKTYASQQQAFLDLGSGRLDAVMGDGPLVKYWLKQAGDEYQIVGGPIVDDQFFGAGDGIAVAKNNQVLLQQINHGLQLIKANGQYEQLKDKYFGDD